MEFLYLWGLFAVKFVTASAIVGFLVYVILLSLPAALKEVQAEAKEKFTFENLIKKYKDNQEKLLDKLKDFDDTKDEKTKKKEAKALAKNASKKEEQERKDRADKIKKLEEQGTFCPENTYVIDFAGDTNASDQDDLIAKVNLILSVATDKDEVIVNLDSPGGVVNGYGLCSATLERIRQKNIHLTVCVDNVAASGGYLMACVASKIVAAPFSYIGSIGVVAQIPNFNKVLKKHDVDYEQVTAGKYKRTLTMFGENTPEGREKFKQELTLIHDRFKEIVSKYRPSMDIDNIATGEFWLAKDALERGLIDEIAPFDSYLQSTLEKTKVCAIKIDIKKQEQKGLLAVLKKFLSAKAWTKAFKEEMLDASNRDDKNLHF